MEFVNEDDLTFNNEQNAIYNAYHKNLLFHSIHNNHRNLHHHGHALSLPTWTPSISPKSANATTIEGSVSGIVMHYLQQGLVHINQATTSIYPSNIDVVPETHLVSVQSNGQFLSSHRNIDRIESHNFTSANNEQNDRMDDSNFSLFTMRNGFIVLCYSLIIIVSLTGNLLVCRVAFGSRDMRTTTNLFIASLACSDIVMTVFNIPFNVIRILPINYPFGTSVCVLVPLLQTSCVYVSTFTMTLIALHRLWTVRQRRTSTGKTSAFKIAVTVLTIWLIALTLSVPHAAFNQVRNKSYKGREFHRCIAQYPKLDFNFRLFLTVEVLITQYLLPLSITLIVYIKIARVIARQGQLICKLSDEKKRRQSEAKRRRIFMLALAVFCFAVCWFPLDVYLFLVDCNLVKLNTDIYITCHWFAMSSVCYNPIIYCWLNEKFRNGVKQTIRDILNFTHFPLMNKEHQSTTSNILSI